MTDVLDPTQADGCDPQSETTQEPHQVLAHEEHADVTEDILQQALNEASATQLTQQLHAQESESQDNNVQFMQQHQDNNHNEHVEQINLNESHTHSHGATSTVVVNTPSGDPRAITLSTLTPASTSPTPLGSKSNPIRIVQQGSTYTSTQQLSQDQIAQIVQVLQRQNIAARSVDGQPTAVFNPKTKTRIVYRVVQPHANAKKPNTLETQAAAGQLTARDYHEAKYGPIVPKKRGPGRPKKRARRESDVSASSESEVEDDPAFGSDSDGGAGDMAHIGQEELTPAEKLLKKREKPITRSGRKSKPPTHLVKDYKAIHRVDWYEDYDDSDGGYSDIYVSDDEANKQNSEKARRKNGCAMCSKAYIGPAGLARHYKMTGHGDPKEVMPELEEPAQSEPVTDSSLVDNLIADATNEEAGILNPEAHLVKPSQETPVRGRGRGRGRAPGRPAKREIEDEAWRPPPHVKTNEPKRKPGRPPKDKSVDSPAGYRGRGRGRGRGQSTSAVRGRGRPPASTYESKLRRQERLQSLLATWSCTEVLQAIVPRMRDENISLYNVMECGLAGSVDERPSYTRMLQLYTELQGKMAEMAEICLRTITEQEQVQEDKEAIQITTAAIAHSIGLEPGLFEVSDLPESDKFPPDQSYSQPYNPDSPAEKTTEDSQPPEKKPKTSDEPEITDANGLDAGGQGKAQPSMLAQVTANPESHTEGTGIPTSSYNPDSGQSIAATSYYSEGGLEQTQLQQQHEQKHQEQQGQELQLQQQPEQQLQQHHEPEPVSMHTSQSTSDLSVPLDNEATAAAVAEMDTLASIDIDEQRRASLAEAVSKILPGDIIQLDGQNIVIPEGANIVQTPDGIVIYQSSDPDAASVLNIKL